MTPSREREPLELITQALPSEPPPEFFALCEGFGIELEPHEVEQLGRYLSLLLANGDRMNLTAIREPPEAWKRHIFDALTLMSVLHDLPPESRVIDVGSGGGVPGLPIAIALPSLRVTLLEATQKKADFLRSTVQALGLDGVHVVADRAETAGQAEAHREVYDAVLARAVGPLPVLAELTVPFAKVASRCIYIKGAKASEELSQAEKALRLLKARHEGTFPTPTGQLVVVVKESSTPKKYPRRPGDPKKNPL